METIRLPDGLGDVVSLEAHNRRLREKTAALDWSLVRGVDEERLRVLLDGLDLDTHADELGLDTMGDAVQEKVWAVFQEKPKPQRRKKAPKGPASKGPQVWKGSPSSVPPAPGEDGEPPRIPRPSAPPASAPRVLTAPEPAEIRQMLEDAVLRDLLGPANGPEEEVDEGNVRDRYLVGLLAPQRQAVSAGTQEDLAVTDANAAEDSAPDPAPATDTMFPSSFGLSLCVDGDTKTLRVRAHWGRYKRMPSTLHMKPDGAPKLVWKRIPTGGTVDVVLTEGAIGPFVVTQDKPSVVVRGAVRRVDSALIVSLFLVNEQTAPEKSRDEAWLFQPELSVEDPAGRAILRKRPYRADSSKIDVLAGDEAAAMSMLYRDLVEFAVGHGVAVHAEPAPEDPTRAVRVLTRVAPVHDVPQQEPPTFDEVPDLVGLCLDMKELAETRPADLPGKLRPLVSAYERWIGRIEARVDAGEDRLGEHRAAAKAAIARCRHAKQRIAEGIACLEKIPDAAEAFRFANRAMWLQRTHTILAEEARRGRKPSLESIDVPKNRTWRTFQIAFVLQALPGITDLGHADRTGERDATADLLWFPTGGGKTEAYLGLAAYTLGLRRLQGEIEGRSGEHGVGVLMRYTLRLLTIQQFQRAAALICACERIRREAEAAGKPVWGAEPFRIGLWVGARSTPNSTADAEEAMRLAHGEAPLGARLGSPAQLTNCPWCGTRIDPGKDIRVRPYTKGIGRTLMFCGDPLGRCPFTERQAPDEGIPVVVVDEEIYRRLPAMVIATVDKFAQMPWNGTVKALFGQVESRCSRHGFRAGEIEDTDSHPKIGGLPAAKSTTSGPLRPPDLIIQDELHLISGPLGTLTGLYETAVDELCSWTVGGKRVRPKVVASTATIRRAGEQVHALFLRRVDVFPPHGVDVGDNFFSVQRDTKKMPGRRYLGICAPGRRLKAALIRTYVAYLGAAQQLFEKYGAAADPWMTLVGYFSSLRELAGMRRLVEDDVRARLRDIDRRGLAARRAPILEELTSRRSSTDIPTILDQLETTFTPEREAKRREKKLTGADGRPPLDVLLATNMISVGVDVKRLGLMVVAGQPKTTAEYIQATSRVGRAAPGLVCTIYNWARPRDLSHYETFEHYHATFYQHVEALSVTPFASRALDRGLSGVLVSLIRLADREYCRNEDAQRLAKSHAIVERALARIRRRAELVTASKAIADDVTAMLNRRLDTWLSLAAQTQGGVRLGYKSKKDGSTRALLAQAGDGAWEEFTCLMSLRDVEPSVPLILDEGASDEPATSGKETW